MRLTPTKTGNSWSSWSVVDGEVGLIGARAIMRVRRFESAPIHPMQMRLAV